MPLHCVAIDQMLKYFQRQSQEESGVGFEDLFTTGPSPGEQQQRHSRER